SGHPAHARPAAKKAAACRPRHAPAAVTRQGGDGSRARGKSEPALGAQRLGRGPTPAQPGRETPQTRCKTGRLEFRVTPAIASRRWDRWPGRYLIKAHSAAICWTTSSAVSGPPWGFGESEMPSAPAMLQTVA